MTLIRIFEELRALGYEGGYDAVRRYARTWSKQHAGETANAYVPLTFAPGADAPMSLLRRPNDHRRELWVRRRTPRPAIVRSRG